MAAFTALQLGTAWARLSGLMDEAAQNFVRTSFSSVVRDNWDLAVGLMDSQGRQLAQSARSIPSFVGTMPMTLRVMLRRFPMATLRPGDVMISNDGYHGTGHLNDITMIRPVFREGRIIAFLGSTFHSTDIGGAPSIEAQDSFAEGLTIPVCRILNEGVENADVIAFLTENLRQPEETLGDIRAQFAAYAQAEPRLLVILREEGIEDFDALSEEVFRRSEAAMRAAIRALPDGTVTDEVTADGFEHPLVIRLALTIAGDALSLDFTGTADQVPRPVNSPLNFTRAYSHYALKCALDPATPINDGSFRPIRIIAPEGSIVNPRRPAPVWGRHLTGHYMPPVIMGALSRILPGSVIADCGSPVWNMYITGSQPDGRRFIRMFFMNGGHGARPDADGPACLSFPSNVATQPIEQFENSLPMLIEEKELITDSGGVGQFRGGLAQRISFRVTGDAPLSVTYRHERVQHPPRGLLGGGPGRAGRELVNGVPVPAKARLILKPGDLLTIETPGGGGMGEAEMREPHALSADRAAGYTTR